MFNNWHKKEKPFLSITSTTGGAGGFARSSGDPSERIYSSDSTLIDDGTHWIRVWTTAATHNVEVKSDTPVQYLLVGGGGSGAYYYGGGGGAGRVMFATETITSGTHTIGVGTGYSVSANSGATGEPDRAGEGRDGDFSFITGFPGGTITAPGGGAGGSSTNPVTNGTNAPYAPGHNGNAGGGGGGYEQLGTGGNGSPFGGAGASATTMANGGGGGGASGPGGVSAGNNGGPPNPLNRQGGEGCPVPWIPTSYGTVGPAPGRWFGGGGSGGCTSGGTTAHDPLAGGAGGGGMGVNDTNNNDTNAVENTGSGGGGGGGNGSGLGQCKGANGIIAMRWQK